MSLWRGNLSLPFALCACASLTPPSAFFSLFCHSLKMQLARMPASPSLHPQSTCKADSKWSVLRQQLGVVLGVVGPLRSLGLDSISNPSKDIHGETVVGRLRSTVLQGKPLAVSFGQDFFRGCHSAPPEGENIYSAGELGIQTVLSKILWRPLELGAEIRRAFYLCPR